MKLSVVICVYNTPEKLLGACLDSVERETLSDFEICIVDDGSEIDYSSVLSGRDVRYIKTENAGIFAARLKGVSMATGDYVTFVDSDDTVSHNYHAPMLKEAVRLGADVVYNDWAFHTHRMRYFCRLDSTVSGTLDLSGEECLSAFLSGEGREHSYYVLWNKIYKRELLLLSMRLAEQAAAHVDRFNYAEDALINFFVHRDAERVAGVHTGYYFYRIHSGQSVAVTDKERLRHQILCMSAVLSAMREALPERDDREALLGLIDGWAAMISRTHYSYAKMGGYTDLYEYIKASYGQSRLRKPTARDSAVYISHGLLGVDFDKQDELLSTVWQRRGRVTVSAKNLTDYHLRTIEYMKNEGIDVGVADEGEITLPPPGIRLRERILHNPLLYRLGMLLVPKGSKLRSFLKRRI